MALIDGKPANETPGLYSVSVRDDDGSNRTLYVEAPALAAIVDALGGRCRDGGPVVWGGRVLPGNPLETHEPDMVIVPVVA